MGLFEFIFIPDEISEGFRREYKTVRKLKVVPFICSHPDMIYPLLKPSECFFRGRTGKKRIMDIQNYRLIRVFFNCCYKPIRFVVGMKNINHFRVNLNCPNKLPKISPSSSRFIIKMVGRVTVAQNVNLVAFVY